jgi:hypothetical protein
VVQKRPSQIALVTLFRCAIATDGGQFVEVAVGETTFSDITVSQCRRDTKSLQAIANPAYGRPFVFSGRVGAFDPSAIARAVDVSDCGRCERAACDLRFSRV